MSKSTRRTRPSQPTMSPAMLLLPISPKMQCPSTRPPSCLEVQLLDMWALFVSYSVSVPFMPLFKKAKPKANPYCPGLCPLGVHAPREWPLERDKSSAVGSDGCQYGRSSSRGAHLWRWLHHHWCGNKTTSFTCCFGDRSRNVVQDEIHPCCITMTFKKFLRASTAKD